MDLSEKDRLVIANQLKILEKLYPEEADYYARHRKAVEEGYKLHYRWLTENFFEEMSEEECREVLDILTMYRVITFSQQQLPEGSGISKDDVRFPGFDGNNEIKQYSYTQYFVINLDRYSELLGDVEYPDFNSHTEMLPTYRRMLRAWKELPDQHELSAEQIKHILEA